MTEADVLKKTRRLLKCDTVRASTFSHTRRKFLITGARRHSTGEWLKHENNQITPVTFDYVEEKVIASGNTWQKVWESVQAYKRLSGLTMPAFLQEYQAERLSL